MLHSQIVTALVKLLMSIGGRIDWSSYGRLLEALADVGEASPNPTIKAAARGIVRVLSVAESSGTFHVIDAYDPQTLPLPESGAIDFRLTGTVQGVGFRFYAQQLANSLGLSGYTRNLPDGSLQVLVNSPAAERRDFALGALQNGLLTGPKGSSVDHLTTTIL